MIALLDEGFGEGSILARLKVDGLDARPTEGQLRELREIGASERLIAGLGTAAVPYPVEILPETVTVPWIYSGWLPFHLFPGVGPFPCWHWVEGKRWPSPGVVEPLP